MIGGLSAYCGIAESSDDLGREASGQSRWQPLDSEFRGDIRSAQIRRRLPAKHVTESKARFEQRGGRHRPGIASGRLLLNRVNETVGVAAGCPRIGGPEESDVLSLAEAQKCGHAALDLIVELG